MKKPIKLSLAEFEKLVESTLNTLPNQFSAYLDNICIVVEEEPPVGMADMLGLYEGIPLIDRSSGDFGIPDRITIFKGPIESACTTQSEIEKEIRNTLLHEIGHYFGLDEEQLQHL
jgi:predicted Zn-dependent protease with MMP-like domain